MSLKLRNLKIKIGANFNCVILVVCILAAFACKDESKDKNTSDIAELNAEPENIIGGSITSGGGGTILANPVSQETVSESVTKIKRDMNLFLNYMSFGHPDATQSLNYPDYEFIKNFQHYDWYSLFIDDIGKTRSIIESTKVTDSTGSPCLFHERETDGSFLPGEGICLSSQRLQAKLNQLDYYPQLLALAVHEYAHALGADEELAQRIQKDTLNLFADGSSSLIESAIADNSQTLKSVLLKLDLSSPKDRSSEISNTLEHIIFQVPSSPLIFIGYSETHFWVEFFVQNMNLIFTVEAIDGHPQNLNNLYGESNEVACMKIYEEYLTGPGEPVDYAFAPSLDCAAQRLVSSTGDITNFHLNTDLRDAYHKVLDNWIGGEDIINPYCDPSEHFDYSVWDEELQEWVPTEYPSKPECDETRRIVINPQNSPENIE